MTMYDKVEGEVPNHNIEQDRDIFNPSMSFIFNAHLPYVKRHSDELGKLEERWLFDALVWSYIPFIEMMKSLSKKNHDFSVCVVLSPTLLAMLKDDFLMKDFEAYLEDSILLGEKEHKRLKNLSDETAKACVDTACRYREHYLKIKHLFITEYNRDVITQWKYLNELTCVEYATTCGTYAFLPNFRNSKETVRAQIKNGIMAFKESMNISPKGFMLPECGYYEGVENELRDYGIHYSFCDIQAIVYASKVPAHGIFNPVYSFNKDVLFFGRDRELSDIIWSTRDGYMSQDNYRDFSKDIGNDVSLDYLTSATHIKNVRLMTGYKYYAIQGNTFEDTVYNPLLAQERVQKDIDDYIYTLKKRFDAVKNLQTPHAISTLIFDLDLFGQRWYEGIDWLQGVFEKLIQEKDIQVRSPSNYLRGYFAHKMNDTQNEINLSFSSWSEKGYAQVWIDETNKILSRDIHRCVALFKKLVQKSIYERNTQKDLVDRIIQQAGRELLLAQSSDWLFILHANKLTNYASREVYGHLRNFNKLYHMLTANDIDFTLVYELEQQNKIFTSFDYSMFDTKLV